VIKIMRLFACLALLLATPLAAQSNAERMLNDRYSRSHDYDLVHQRIELRSFNWDSASFDGVVTTTLRSLRAGLDSVVLDAGALLDFSAVETVSRSGQPTGRLRHSRLRDTLVVYLPRPATFGDTLRFRLAYHGRVEDGRGLTFIEADSEPPRRPRQLWSQGEDENNHFWFPTYDFPNDKMTWEVWATVPRGFTAVSNGKMMLDRPNADGTRTFRWYQERSSATYLVSLIVEPLVKIHDTWRGIPVDYYVYRQDSALARPLFRLTPDMIETYSKLTGVPYPWNKYAQTTVADFFGGMENVSATTLVDWLPDRTAYADRPWYWYELIAHELAHQWFGDYVTTANWANMWLNEGFATFMPGQYWRAKQGDHAGQDYYLEQYQQAIDTDKQRRMPLAALGSNNVYPKGAMVLEMLRKYLGDARFWAGIKRYLTSHALGVAVTDDLRQAVLEATGENLDWFWSQWMYQAGLPEFTVTAKWDSSGSLLLTVEQTQVDTATADSTGLRYSVPSAFRMPVEVRVRTGAGDVRQRAWLEQRSQTLRIDGVSSAPHMVVFDVGNTIYKTLKFDQPSGWLAEQIARDDNLWNRWWAIGELASRTTDSTAARALAKAATSSDYYLTRAQASTALSKMPGDIALPALLAAAKDTSAQVRQAAIAALGLQGGDQARNLAATAFEKDTSYQVRAVALTVVTKLDPANAAGSIRRGLASTSYQNSIQDAALAAVAQLNDTSFVDQVDALMGQQDTPALALAALAVRGNARAMRLLTGHLGDSREVVRTRTLQAFEYVVPKDQALTQLRQARDHLPAEAGLEVDELITKLSGN
jgi:aminopeptidase N